MMTHDRLDDVLRSLDAAPAEPTPGQRARAEELLASITTPEPGNVASIRPRPRITARLLPVAAACLLGVGVLVWPWNPANDRAYADWTATPVPVDPALADRVAANCRTVMGNALGASPVRRQVAEQRGGHVFVALRSDSGTAECLAPADTGRVDGGTGSSGDSLQAPLAPREAEVWGAGVQGGREGAYAYTRGLLGADVVAVTIRAGDLVVDATVADGEYVAWWPVTLPSEGEPVAIDMSVDVTYADGTVSRDHGSRPEMERPGATGLGRVSEGRGSEGGTHVGFAEGLVGSRVVAVTVRADGTDTVAEVADGGFSARWDLPAGTLADGTVPEIHYSVTLDDGTVLDDVVPLNR